MYSADVQIELKFDSSMFFLNYALFIIIKRNILYKTNKWYCFSAVIPWTSRGGTLNSFHMSLTPGISFSLSLQFIDSLFVYKTNYLTISF